MLSIPYFWLALFVDQKWKALPLRENENFQEQLRKNRGKKGISFEYCKVLTAHYTAVVV